MRLSTAISSVSTAGWAPRSLCDRHALQIPNLSGVGALPKRRLAGQSHFDLCTAQGNGKSGLMGYHCRSKNPRKLHQLVPPPQQEGYHFTRWCRNFSTVLAPQRLAPKPERFLLAALNAGSRDRDGWVPYDIPLTEAFAAVTSLNAATALEAGTRHGPGAISEALVSCPDDCRRPPSALETLVAAAWGLPKPPVPFMLLGKPKRTSQGNHWQLQKQCKSIPILLPLTATSVDDEVYALHPPSAPQENEASQTVALLLLKSGDPEKSSGLQVRIVRAHPQALVPMFLQTVQQHRPDTGDDTRTAEALSLLHGVLAADIVASQLRVAHATPQDATLVAAATAVTRAPPTTLANLLLAVTQHAVQHIAEAAPSLPPSMLLHAVGSLVHLGTPRPCSFLPAHQIEQLLLQVLSAAKPLMLEHQRHLDLLFLCETQSATSSESSNSSGNSMAAEACADETETECNREQQRLDFPLQDAVFVLALLGWLQRYGPPSARSCGANLLESIADCVGERIEELDATEVSNLLFAVSWPRSPLTAWQEYLLFMAARRLLRLPVQPVLAARVVCALADIGLEDHTFYATLLNRLEPAVPVLSFDALGGLLRACAKVRVRQLDFLLPVLARLEAAAAELRPTVAAQALEAAGDLDIKTRSFDGLWSRVCEALNRQHLLHASLLPAALLLMEHPSLVQHLLDAWTVAFRALVSGHRKVNKYIIWHIIKKHRFIAAASATGVLGFAKLPSGLCEAMDEIETQEGSRVSGCDPESSGFHLEVAASLGRVAFEQEAKAGPFLVDLLINGKGQQQALKNARDSIHSGHGFLSETSVTEGKSEQHFTFAGANSGDHGCTRSGPSVPRLHQQGHVRRQPWEPRRQTAREIAFAVN